MSASAEARLNALDRVLDSQTPSEGLAQELFDVVDTLDAQPSLRRALTDPGTPEKDRSALVDALFAGRVSGSAVEVLSEAAKLRWPTVGGLAVAVERQAVRAAFSAAQVEGKLDEAEDQLFRLGRLVDANNALREALGDRGIPLDRRQGLIFDVVADKVLPVVALLARRAVAARKRTFDLTVEEYLTIASQLRKRAVATVEVAQPLTKEQEQRLAAALSKQVGRDVSVHVVLNPTVLGGVRVSLGDEVIEGTVAGRLEDAQRKLS
ncbi:F0F1 ATP synthase subunit delta [Candidatus Darwinibacter acetoxidans]